MLAGHKLTHLILVELPRIWFCQRFFLGPINVYNPTTGQIVKLPEVRTNGRKMYARLGYDPVDDQYKVLCVVMARSKAKYWQPEHLVCTVSSSQKQEWRKIENTTGGNYHSVYTERHALMVRYTTELESQE
ncbi:unnamed protein product [Brassica rapa]|uniref:F-box associated beta-propeller type 3 domain-containing protein n=2 Tax=Brassica TaxID=3705 RepID=A0A8D9M9P4_BRACM|nr:unnamed protein product [Brassica napus]CAG7904042.1 unnamed protein product [Brassica rapa]